MCENFWFDYLEPKPGEVPSPTRPAKSISSKDESKFMYDSFSNKPVLSNRDRHMAEKRYGKRRVSGEDNPGWVFADEHRKRFNTAKVTNAVLDSMNPISFSAGPESRNLLKEHGFDEHLFSISDGVILEHQDVFGRPQYHSVFDLYPRKDANGNLILRYHSKETRAGFSSFQTSKFDLDPEVQVRTHIWTTNIFYAMLASSYDLPSYLVTGSRFPGNSNKIGDMYDKIADLRDSMDGVLYDRHTLIFENEPLTDHMGSEEMNLISNILTEDGLEVNELFLQGAVSPNRSKEFIWTWDTPSLTLTRIHQLFRRLKEDMSRQD